MLDCMLLEFLRAKLGFGAEMQFTTRPENEGKLVVGGDQSLDSRESPDSQPVPRGPQGLKWHLFHGSPLLWAEAQTLQLRGTLLFST